MAGAAYRRVWREGRKERDRENHRRWYLANREARIEANQVWREANPEKARALARANSRRRRLDRNNASIQYASVVLADPCSYCDADSEHIDHIEPVARGGSNEWTNLTGACASCNLIKRAHSLLRFLLLREER